MDATTIALTYSTRLEEVIWGIILIAVTMMMHAYAMLLTLSVSDVMERRAQKTRRSIFSGVGVLVLASWMITLAHLVEVMVWAAFLVWHHAFPSYSAAYYFSLLQYTTVGSDLSLPDRWRLLGGMIAIAGLLTFAWSTTVLLTLVDHFQSKQLSAMKKEKK